MKNLEKYLRNKGSEKDVQTADELLKKGQTATKNDKPVTKKSRKDLYEGLGGC